METGNKKLRQVKLMVTQMYPPLKAMTPHSSTFAWKIPWMEEPGRLHSMGSLESDTTERLHFHFSLSCIGEGNGNPLQCSCLENLRDGGAWWAAVSGVTQSWTQLEQHSTLWKPTWQYLPIKPFLASSMVNLLVIFSNSLSCKGKRGKHDNNEKIIFDRKTTRGDN